MCGHFAGLVVGVAVLVGIDTAEVIQGGNRSVVMVFGFAQGILGVVDMTNQKVCVVSGEDPYLAFSMSFEMHKATGRIHRVRRDVSMLWECLCLQRTFMHGQ